MKHWENRRRLAARLRPRAPAPGRRPRPSPRSLPLAALGTRHARRGEPAEVGLGARRIDAADVPMVLDQRRLTAFGAELVYVRLHRCHRVARTHGTAKRTSHGSQSVGSVGVTSGRPNASHNSRHVWLWKVNGGMSTASVSVRAMGRLHPAQTSLRALDTGAAPVDRAEQRRRFPRGEGTAPLFQTRLSRAQYGTFGYAATSAT